MASRIDQLRALGIVEPAYLAEAIAPKSQLGVEAYPEFSLEQELARGERERAEYEEAYPTKISKFMDALSTLSGLVEPGGPQGATMLFGGLPGRTMKQLFRAGLKEGTQGGIRSAARQALQATRRGTELGSPLRTGTLENVREGMMLWPELAAGGKEAASAHGFHRGKGEIPEDVLQWATREQTELAASARDALKASARYNRERAQTLAEAGFPKEQVEELRKLADDLDAEGKFVQTWHNRQIQAIRRGKKMPVIGVAPGRGESETTQTMFHELAHGAQSAGKPYPRTMAFGELPLETRRRIAEGLEFAGHSPEWSRTPVEQEASYLEGLFAGRSPYLSPVGARGEMLPQITAEEAEEIASRLGLRNPIGTLR